VKPTDRLELRTVAFALLASLLLWNLPFGGLLLYPFKLLATWLHEASHGLAMILTGVGFDHLTIYRDTSGLAYGTSEAGGVGSAVIAAAGYMGTPLWGAVLLVVTPNARLARWALLVLGTLLVGTALTVIGTPEGDMFGPWAVGAIGAACAAAAFLVPAPWRLAIAHFIAAQSCVNAILDIRVLLRPSQVVGGKVAGASDAHNMAAATFGTTATWAVWLWAIMWLLWSLLVLYIALRLSGSRALAQVAPAVLEPIEPVGSADPGAPLSPWPAAAPGPLARVDVSAEPAVGDPAVLDPVVVASGRELRVEQTAGTRPVIRPARSRRAAARKIRVRRERWFRGPGSQ
jgi:preprotein translocase subunit SecG